MRVDILERLADLIRPALAWRESSPGEKPAGAFDGRGFVVTQAMTSLAGSAGEDFASILRALGYRMERRPPLPPKPPAVEPAPAEATPAEDAAAADKHRGSHAERGGCRRTSLKRHLRWRPLKRRRSSGRTRRRRRLRPRRRATPMRNNRCCAAEARGREPSSAAAAMLPTSPLCRRPTAQRRSRPNAAERTPRPNGRPLLKRQPRTPVEAEIAPAEAASSNAMPQAVAAADDGRCR